MRAAAVALAAVLLVAGGCGADAEPSAPRLAPAAAAPDPGGPFGIVAATADGRARPSVRAGRTGAVTLRVVNPAPRPRTFALRAAGVRARVVTAPGAAPGPTAGWLRAPATVRVGARASRAVTVRVAVPPGTPPGRYAAALVAHAAVPATPPAGVELRVEAAARIAVRVTEPPA